MPEIEPRVDEEKLRLLLAEGHESASLDFKASCDLRERRELVAITKDIGAMNVLGGYIVVGADDRGQPTGQVTAGDVQAFDQANLQGKLRRYLPESVEVRTAAHEIDGNTFIIIYVAPHPDGFAVFEQDGTYAAANGRDRFEFRAGDVFARHGTASERWTQADILRIRQGLRERERERWRREFREDLDATLGAAAAAQNVAGGPAVMLDWRLDEETLVGAVIEQIRRNDAIPLELLLTRLPAEARAAIDAGNRDALGLILDRVAAISASVLLAGREDLFDRTVQILVSVYDGGYDARGMPRGGPALLSAVIWLDVLRRVFAIGAFAVRRRAWRAVATLTLQVGSGYDFRDDYYKTWLRHGLTMASRANLLGVEPGQRGESISLLNLALQDIDRLPALRPDLPAGDDALLSSLCQYDLLACLCTLTRGGDDESFYPSFGQFYAERSDPAVVAVLDHPDAREAIYPRSGDELAQALRTIGRLARTQALPFAGWRGYQHPRILAFLREHPETGQTATA